MDVASNQRRIINVRIYDIFSGSVEDHPLWLESVQGLEPALARMKEHAEQAPGPYFIWDSTTEAILESVNTSTKKNADVKPLQKVGTELIQQGDGDTPYGQIVDLAAAIMHSEYASVQVLEPQPDKAGELILLAFRGFNPEAAHFWQRVPADSWSTCAAALRTGEHVIAPNVEECDFMKGTEDLTTYRNTGIRAVQSTPLLSRSGQVLGMISTHWKNVHTAMERELRTLDGLARQAADLIEHRSLESR